jgi:hypothetical protein
MRVDGPKFKKKANVKKEPVPALFPKSLHCLLLLVTLASEANSQELLWDIAVLRSDPGMPRISACA